MLLAATASDQSDLLAQKGLGQDLTGQNRSSRHGLECAAVAYLIVETRVGLAGVGKYYSAGYVADL